MHAAKVKREVEIRLASSFTLRTVEEQRPKLGVVLNKSERRDPQDEPRAPSAARLSRLCCGPLAFLLLPGVVQFLIEFVPTLGSTS